MEMPKNITLDIEETLRLRKHSDDITAILELRKKLQKIEMWREHDAIVYEQSQYKPLEIKELYHTIGLRNQNEKKTVDINPSLIYHLS